MPAPLVAEAEALFARLRQGQPGVADRLRELLPRLRAVAEGGVAHAFAALGDLLAELGQNRQAREHHVRAAGEGLPAAMWAAGCRLRDGLGGPADPVGAVRWFLRLLDHGGLAGRPADGEALIGIVRREGA